MLLDCNHFDPAADVFAADGWYLQALFTGGIIDSGVAIDADPAMLEAIGHSKVHQPNLSFHLPEFAWSSGTASQLEPSCLETSNMLRIHRALT